MHTEDDYEDLYATSPKVHESSTYRSKATRSDQEEALYLSALQIAFREGFVDNLRYSDMHSSGYRFIHYYIRDDQQREICKVNLREARRGRDAFLSTYTDDDGWDETILDQAKKEILLNKISRA